MDVHELQNSMLVNNMGYNNKDVDKRCHKVMTKSVECTVEIDLNNTLKWFGHVTGMEGMVYLRESTSQRVRCGRGKETEGKAE